MPNAVRLDNIDHHDLKYAIRHGAAFGDAVNQTLVLPTEFAEVQREYPILLRRRDDGSFYAVAILGFDRGENLYLDGERWAADYVPAMQARGPFSIGLSQGPDGPDAMIHVDLDDARIGRDGGQPLFRPHGGNAPVLDRIAGTLRTIQQGADLSPRVFNAFATEGLIAPADINITSDGVGGYRISDVFAVSGQALARLDGAALKRLNDAGFLSLAFMAVNSLGNLRRLIDMKNAKAGA
ncbi:SapC family protein [Asticcacaulis solisilvae]|uniref:SapC family protein n=1 Tax=Asticcacaulis solisilvae TaxID=1217274 RepID=UPI003FD720E7